jgi:DNA-binding PadR family transcriptional regulator
MGSYVFAYQPKVLSPGASSAQFFILLALMVEPNHGQGIVAQVLGDTVGGLVIAKSTIYDVLKDLEKKKFISSREPERKTGPREYRITAEGRDALRYALRLYECGQAGENSFTLRVAILPTGCRAHKTHPLGFIRP